jgi:hypothetical protein
VLQVPAASPADVVMIEQLPSRTSTAAPASRPGPSARHRASASAAADVDQCCRMRYAPAETHRPSTDSPLASPNGPADPAVVATSDAQQGDPQVGTCRLAPHVVHHGVTTGTM